MAATATVTESKTAAPVLKLRSENNPCWNEKSQLICETGLRIEATAYPEGDWRRTLMEDGYVVIKSAIPLERAQQHGERVRGVINSFGTALDYNDKSTWKFENLPDPSHINTFTEQCMPHEKPFWDVRQDKDVRKYFEELWGTKELLVSFDAVNVTLPGRKDQQDTATFWPHIDQSPYRPGLQGVQGLVSLSKAGPKDGGLVVYKGSHKLFRKYVEECCDANDPDVWHTLDQVSLSKEQLQWFLDNGCEEIKIECDVGDLILWDSRTIHYGKALDDDSEQVRTVVYACYVPAEWATDKDLEMKKEAFFKYRNTTHWPHINIVSEFKPFKTAGHVKSRTEPLQKLDMNDEDLLKLAGVLKY